MLNSEKGKTRALYSPDLAASQRKDVVWFLRVDIVGPRGKLLLCAS